MRVCSHTWPPESKVQIRDFPQALPWVSGKEPAAPWGPQSTHRPNTRASEGTGSDGRKEPRQTMVANLCLFSAVFSLIMRSVHKTKTPHACIYDTPTSFPVEWAPIPLRVHAGHSQETDGSSSLDQLWSWRTGGTWPQGLKTVLSLRDTSMDLGPLFLVAQPVSHLRPLAPSEI